MSNKGLMDRANTVTTGMNSQRNQSKIQFAIPDDIGGDDGEEQEFKLDHSKFNSNLINNSMF